MGAAVIRAAAIVAAFAGLAIATLRTGDGQLDKSERIELQRKPAAPAAAPDVAPQRTPTPPFVRRVVLPPHMQSRADTRDAYARALDGDVDDYLAQVDELLAELAEHIEVEQ